MNRRAILLGLALSLLACARIEEAPAPAPEHQTKELIITAYGGDDDTNTKTARQANTDVYWSPGDAISLFFRNGENGGSRFVAQNTEEVAITQFKGTIDVISGSGEDTGGEFWFWGIYPYSTENSCDGSSITTVIPAQQTGKAGTFADNTFITMARAKGLELGFYNICSGVKFTLSRNDIKEVRIRGNNNEDIAGKIKAEWDVNGKPVVAQYIEGAKEVSVAAPGGGTFAAGTEYYLVIAPTLLSDGFTMTLLTSDFKYGEFVYGSERQFKRSIFTAIPDLDTRVNSWAEPSKAFLPYEFLPNEVDKTTITEAYFHISDPTTTATVISAGNSDYEPIYFEMIGTVAHFYTTGQVYNCSAFASSFEGWESLRNLDLSMFDVSESYSMGSSFANCYSLQSLNLSSFNTSNVQSFATMFYNCVNLRALDVTNFDTSKAIDMQGMFRNCKSLTSLDVSGFNTNAVTDFSSMFFGCSGLNQLNVSNFDTSNATNLYEMFDGLSVENLDVTNFNTSNVVRADYLFGNCWNLREIDVSHFDTSNMEWIGYMFANCRSLESIDLSAFDISKVTYLNGLFQNCARLKNIILPSSSTSNLLGMYVMFEGCSSLEYVDLSSFDTSTVTNMMDMFMNCHSLKSLDLSSFNTANVPSYRRMFYGCSNLEHLNISSFNPATISDAEYMFCNTQKLTTLDLGEFDLSQSNNEGAGDWLGELVKQCHIRCTPETKEALIAASSLLSDSKYIWYTDGSPLPDVDYENEEGLYCSTDYSKDKTVRTVQLASEGEGIDLVVMGDAYSDRLIDDGTYDADMEKAIDAIFAVEPYKSFKHLFNIYIVYAVSENEVIGKSTALSCINEGNPGSLGWTWKAYYASAAKVSSPGECSPVVIMNSTISDGAATGFLSIAPDYMNDPLRDDYHGGVSEAVAYISGPNDARFDYIVRHEFGHSFGFLMDEYSKYSGAITSWDIESWQCCFAFGMWKNVDLVSDNTVKWAKFINDPRYAGTGIGVYEGALYETGAWRPSPESIMNSTDSGFNAPSREAIYYKIHKLAYGRDWNYNFEDFVTYDLPNINADKARLSAPKARTMKTTSSFKREPVFKKSIVTGPDGKERIKIEMN